MLGARLTRRLVVLPVGALVLLGAGCSTSDTKDLDGGFLPGGDATSSASPSPSASPSASGTSTAGPSIPAAVAKELDTLSKNLRDLSQAESSRDPMSTTSSALAAVRSDVKRLRGSAYGTSRSCSVVDSALASTRADAARTSSGAATVRARNADRSELLATARATLDRLVAAAGAKGRTATPDETAAIADARATLAGAADQISRTEESAGSAVATAQDLLATAESVATKAC